METKVKVTTTYNCSLVRAFKSPILCDVTKVHTGMGLMPKIVSSSDDKDWGKIGSTKKVYAAKSLTQKGGFILMDKVIDRIENQYWKIVIYDFQSWMLGFYKFGATWAVTEIEKEKILINYDYTLYANGVLLIPFQWLFGKLFWRRYMKQVLENIRQLTLNKEPYQYE